MELNYRTGQKYLRKAERQFGRSERYRLKRPSLLLAKLLSKSDYSHPEDLTTRSSFASRIKLFFIESYHGQERLIFICEIWFLPMPALKSVLKNTT